MDWQELVEKKLLSTGAVSGVAVLTKTGGGAVYTHGLLRTHQEQDWSQFCGLFSAYTTEEYLPPPKLGLNLDDRVDFVVFRKEQCSVYATSAGGVYNLVVRSLPVGVLVAVGQAPTLLSQTLSSVEDFATFLRH